MRTMETQRNKHGSLTIVAVVGWGAGKYSVLGN
jgi:hypothetical protein